MEQGKEGPRSAASFCSFVKIFCDLNCTFMNVSECGPVHLSADNLRGQKKASSCLELEF